MARPLPRLRRVEQLRRGAPGGSPGRGRGRPASLALDLQSRAQGLRPDRRGGGGAHPLRASTSSTACSAAASCPARMVLIGGEPGIGKSTLLLQVAHLLGRTHGTVLYVSGEESERQIKLRGERLGIAGRRALPDGRDLARAHPRAGRGAEARGPRRRLRPDRLLVAVPLGPRQHQPGARGGDPAPLRREGPRDHDLPHRPRHQGRQPGRAQVPRAHRRHRALLRGREAPAPPHRARGQEPLRRGLARWACSR